MRLWIEIISPGELNPNSEPVKSSTGPKRHHLFTCLICQYQHGGSEPRLHRSLTHSQQESWQKRKFPAVLSHIFRRSLKQPQEMFVFLILFWGHLCVWRCRRRIKQMDTADSCWPQITHPSDQSKWWLDKLWLSASTGITAFQLSLVYHELIFSLWLDIYKNHTNLNGGWHLEGWIKMTPNCPSPEPLHNYHL